MKCKILVTSRDIALGTRDSYRVCPIALAANRALCYRGYVEVQSDEILWQREEKDGRIAYYVADMPRAGSDFVDDFDTAGAKAVLPFAFEVEFKPKEFRRDDE